MENRIMVVDDEKSIRAMLTQAFSRKGYTVIEACSAEEALETMAKKYCSVLFLDLNLPAMNGVELCRRIRKEWPMAISIAVTGYASLYELSECRDAGFEDYCLKPVKLSELFEAAEHAFKKLEKWKRQGSG